MTTGSKVTDAFLGSIYSILQGMQLALQSGRTRSDRPCSLHHASMLEQIKVTATIYYVVQTLECTFIQGSDKVVMVIC